jgi:hypothetical protein
MVYEIEESWLLYASSIKAQVNKQFKAFGASWKKVLHNDLELLGLTQAEYDIVLEKLAAFEAHINHIEVWHHASVHFASTSPCCCARAMSHALRSILHTL